MRRFKTIYPSEDKVISQFSPQKWSSILYNISICANVPHVTLKQLNTMYINSNLSEQIVKNNIIGIYSFSGGREPLDDNATWMAANMFVAKYGHSCTPHDMLVYFANYNLEFKEGYKDFDKVDILRQYGRKFQSWWMRKLENIQDTKEDKAKPVQATSGYDNKLIYLASLIRDADIDEYTKIIKETNLYKMGFVKDEEIPKIIDFATTF